jgi:hypothetical protein
LDTDPTLTGGGPKPGNLDTDPTLVSGPPKPGPAGADSAVTGNLDYEVRNLIGRGAYGEVYLARTRAGKFCAVKVVYRVSFEEDRPYEREYQGIVKFEPISRLSDSQLQILWVGRRETGNRPGAGGGKGRGSQAHHLRRQDRTGVVGPPVDRFDHDIDGPRGRRFHDVA